MNIVTIRLLNEMNILTETTRRETNQQIWAAANMRARDGCTPVECLDLLVALLRENDNCENSLSDDYYVAQVI